MASLLQVIVTYKKNIKFVAETCKLKFSTDDSIAPNHWNFLVMTYWRKNERRLREVCSQVPKDSSDGSNIEQNCDEANGNAPRKH